MGVVSSRSVLKGLTQLATIYTPNSTTGKFETPYATNVKCRLIPLPLFRGGITVGFERAELATQRRIMLKPDEAVPPRCQFVVDGERFNMQAGTLMKARGMKRVEYQIAMLTKATV